jgi:hypothetical protein
MGAQRDRLIADLVYLQKTGYRWVAMTPEAAKAFRKVDFRWRKRLERHFRNYGVRDATLPPEALASEGRHATGGAGSRDVLVLAFKAFQHRLYGVVTTIGEKKTFIGLRLITDKKTDRADQALLRRVAQDFLPYHE